MTQPSYGIVHRGRIVRAGSLPDTYEVEVAALAGDTTLGPFESAVPSLTVDDRVLLAQIGASQSDLVITGKLPPTPLDAILPIDITDVTGLQTSLNGKQPLDSDLTAIATIAAADNDVIQRIAGAWTNRTMAQLLTALNAQPLNSDLTAIAGLSPADNDILQRIAGAWTNRTMAQLKVALALAIADISGLQAALDLKAPLADPTFTGTLRINPGRLVNNVVALTDAATIATDASLGNNFRVTLGGNRLLGSPTNPSNGQVITWEFIQDATGSRTLSLAATFGLGTDITSVVLSTTAGRRDYMTAIYNSTVPRWSIINLRRGYS